MSDNRQILRLVTTATPTTDYAELLTLLLADLGTTPIDLEGLGSILLDVPQADFNRILGEIREKIPGKLLFLRTDAMIPPKLRQDWGICLVFPTDMPLQWIIQTITDAQQYRISPIVEDFALNIAHDASQSLHYGETIEKALIRLKKLVPYTAANVALFEEGYAAIKYHRGYNADIKLLLDQLRIPLSMPNFQRMLLTGEALIIDNIHENQYWQDIDPQGWIKSWMGIPIKKNNVVIGVLNFDSDEIGKFKPYHQAMVREVIDHITLLVETHQLYDTLNEYTVLLSVMNRQNTLLFTPLPSYRSLNEMCRHIAETVVSSYGKTDCGVLLVDEETNVLQRFARAGEFQVRATGDLSLDGKALVIEAVRTMKMVYAPDVTKDPNYMASEPDTRSELAIPLLVNEWVLGVLDLQSNQRNAFSVRDQESLWAFAQYAALAIQNLMVVNTQRDIASEMEMYVAERTRDLEISQRRVEAILNHTNDPILLLTQDGYISQGNVAFERTMGLSEISYYDTDLRHILETGATIFDQALTETLAEQKSKTFSAQLRTRRKDHKLIEAEITLAPVSTIPDEEEQTFVCTIRDVTHYREVEQTLRRSLERERELSQMKTDFIRTVHHQFNTPLSIIMSSTGILRMTVDNLIDPESKTYTRMEKHFDKIDVEIRQLAEMLAEAKLVSETRKFTPNPVDIVKEVSRAIEALHIDTPPKQSIEVHVNGDNPIILGDSGRLQKAIFHMLSNAVKYSPDDSHIHVELTLMHEQIMLHVIDNGRGIPNNELSNLFQPFFRGQAAATSRGVGLGLTIIKQAAELHGGTVSVNSEPGIETRFTMTIPRTPPRQ